VKLDLSLLRYAVFAVAALAALAALGAMAVQRRVLNPFGAPARTLRRLTDPVIRPFERRLLRAGGNPQNAPWWLLGTAILGGILVITIVEWVIRQLYILVIAAGSGGRSLLYLLVDWTFSLLVLALFVRVVGSWFGVSPYRKWMRPFVALTEWFLAPLRRVLPTFGPFDISPFVAYFLLYIVRSVVLTNL
jgi:YggT family protein